MKAFCDKHYMQKDKHSEKVYCYPNPCKLCKNPFLNELWAIVYKQNQNVLIITEGETGSGKSWLDLNIASSIDPGFNEKTIDERVIFSVKDFMSILNEEAVEKKLYKGAAIMIEETGIQADHHKWWSYANMCVSYILQTFRYRNLIVLFNVPIMDFVDSDSRKLFKFHIETLNINQDKGIVRCKIKKQKYNSTASKLYRTFLRYKMNDEWLKIKFWSFRKPPVKLRNRYEDLHIPFKDKLTAKLAVEMAAMEKKVTDESKKATFIETDAVKYILEHRDEFCKLRKGRMIVSQPLVETHFQIGKYRAARLKAGVERTLEHFMEGEHEPGKA